MQTIQHPEQQGQQPPDVVMFTFRAPRPLKRRIMMFAAAQEPKRTVAAVCIEAIEQYLDRNSTEPVPTVREIVRKVREQGSVTNEEEPKAGTELS